MTSHSERRIVIIGFMGCGKTAIAGELARRLGCDMIDLDLFIVTREGRTPAQIIEQDGEPAFREIETDALRDLLPKTEARVIALGGGTWTIEANRDLIVQHDSVTVWLDAPFNLCWKRITASGDRIRPLARARDRARELYERRRASYELAAFKTEVSDQEDADQVAAKIQTELKSQ